MPEPSADLIKTLRRLSKRELERTLSTLSIEEREQVRASLTAEQSVEPPFEMLAGLSPWLLRKIDSARSGQGSHERVTEATRALLLRSFQELAKDKPAGPPAPHPVNRLRALISARSKKTAA